MAVPDAVVAAVAQALRRGDVRDKDDLHRVKGEASRRAGISAPTDRELALLLPPELASAHRDVLRTKPVRTQSGVAVVAVMSSPASCPHGKCTFCPGGPEVGVPQSYTGFEPSTMRAIAFSYDPYRIVRSRLAQLANNGHSVEKVDVVVQGGTFPARDASYQDWFIAGIFAALNDGPGDGTWESEAAWTPLSAGERAARLLALQQANESASCRAVGLTIETKPDWCLAPHVDQMLRLGATRVEIGLQTLEEDVLAATHRGHTLQDSRDAMRIARDAGFKVCVHLMPGLPRPRGTTGPGALDPDPEADLVDGRRMFDETDWRPDMLKVYPTLVVHEGETLLKRQWERGEFHPYDTPQAARVIAGIKAHVPPYCRIQRVDRDIPTTHVDAGVKNSNLRQYVLAELAARGQHCRCIRCREPARRAEEGRAVDASRLILVRRDYDASGGSEVFLAFEDPVADAIAGFVRLRRVAATAHRPETHVPSGAAFVRELKVYGTAQRLGEHDDDPESGAFQHKGLGARLMAEAERIAFAEWSVGRLLVIAGPGVKPYYRKQGYTDCGPYVAKDNAA